MLHIAYPDGASSMPPSLFAVHERLDVKMSENQVTRPNEPVFKYHIQMHQYPERLFHYFGLKDRASLHFLRLSQPVLYFWANCFRPWMYNVMLGMDPTTSETPQHDICLVFRLFRERNQSIDQFEASFGDVSIAEFIRQLRDGFNWQSRSMLAPDSVHNEARRAWILAYCLIVFKRILQGLSSGAIVVPDLVDMYSVVAMWERVHRLEIIQSPAYNNFAIPQIPYGRVQQLRIVAPDHYREDPFEQYQRLFILLKHVDDQLMPFMWRLYTYDFDSGRFREPEDSYILEGSEIRHAPHWMQEHLLVEEREEQQRAHIRSLQKPLQRRHSH